MSSGGDYKTANFETQNVRRSWRVPKWLIEHLPVTVSEPGPDSLQRVRLGCRQAVSQRPGCIPKTANGDRVIAHRLNLRPNVADL